MRDIWVISDTHFFHSNMLRFKDSKGRLFRGDKFSNASEMNEYMVYKWNSVVKPGDLVYHLGDVFIGTKDEFQKLWPRLMGSKRLIVGNHDDIKYLSTGGFFQKVLLWRMWPEFKLVFSHVPLHPDSIKKGFTNIHGHIHEKNSPKGPYRNVCVEKVDYTPIHIEELAN